MSTVEIVQAMAAAYLTQDLPTLQQLLADDLVFTSPQDDHIDRETFLKCWFPGAARLTSPSILQVADDGDGGAFLMYEYQLASGDRFRNTQYVTVRDGQVVEIQMFFGGYA